MTAVLPPPDLAAANDTAGVLCHFIVSSPALTEAFRAWVEHHPGDLDCDQIRSYLSEVHDLLAPTCEIPADVDLNPSRRLRSLDTPYPVPGPP